MPPPPRRPHARHRRTRAGISPSARGGCRQLPRSPALALSASPVCVYVCVCARARVCVYVRACVRACVRAVTHSDCQPSDTFSLTTLAAWACTSSDEGSKGCTSHDRWERGCIGSSSPFSQPGALFVGCSCLSPASGTGERDRPIHLGGVLPLPTAMSARSSDASGWASARDFSRMTSETSRARRAAAPASSSPAHCSCRSRSDRTPDFPSPGRASRSSVRGGRAGKSWASRGRRERWPSVRAFAPSPSEGGGRCWARGTGLEPWRRRRHSSSQKISSSAHGCPPRLLDIDTGTRMPVSCFCTASSTRCSRCWGVWPRSLVGWSLNEAGSAPLRTTSHSSDSVTPSRRSSMPDVTIADGKPCTAHCSCQWWGPSRTPSVLPRARTRVRCWQSSKHPGTKNGPAY